jgi:hypothetical protein
MLGVDGVTSRYKRAKAFLGSGVYFKLEYLILVVSA